MRRNFTLSIAIVLPAILASFSHAQDAGPVIVIDFRNGASDTGSSLDDATLNGIFADPNAEVLERSGIPFSVPVVEDDREGDEQLHLTVNSFTGTDNPTINTGIASLGLGINSGGFGDSFVAFDADFNESLTISFSQDLFIQEVDLVGLDAIVEDEVFSFGGTLITDPPPSSIADVTSLITDDDPDGMFLAAGETLLLEATVGDVGIQAITVQISSAMLLGDVDLDGVVSFSDISPFISVLSSGSFQAEADINGSGMVDFADISPFISLLSSN